MLAAVLQDRCIDCEQSLNLALMHSVSGGWARLFDRCKLEIPNQSKTGGNQSMSKWGRFLFLRLDGKTEI